MHLTVLGASAACQAPGGACSSYLVQSGATSIVLDCGPGSVANLRRAVDYHTVTAIVISHLHSDHILDLVPYSYGLRYGPGATGHRLPLWMPPGSVTHLAALGQAVGGDAGLFDAAFEVREYDPATTLVVGEITLAFVPVQHYVPTWAIRCRVGARTLAYSADSGPTAALAELGRDADLFLCEATLLERDVAEETPGHLTAAEAGEIARAAGARRLLLTHLWPELGPEALLAAARATFAGPTEIAREGTRYIIDPAPR
jgi:ribonuclease BN (tRNA processing enzyme)